MSRLVLFSALLIALLAARGSAFEFISMDGNLRGLKSIALIVDLDQDTAKFFSKELIYELFQEACDKRRIKNPEVPKAVAVLFVQIQSIEMELSGNEIRAHLGQTTILRNIGKPKRTVCVHHASDLGQSALLDNNFDRGSSTKAITVIVSNLIDDFTESWDSDNNAKTKRTK